MVASRIPEWGRRREAADRRSRVAGRLLAWVTHVVAALTLLTLVTVGTSQACPAENNPPLPATQGATGTQSATQLGAAQSPAEPSALKCVINGNACCANGAGHCHGSAGLIIAEWLAAQNVILRVDIPPLQTPPSSSGPDTQFRPPRIIL